MSYISAMQGSGTSRVYLDSSGNVDVFTGGTRAARNFNPGNLRYGTFAQSEGAIGRDKDGFAIFPDKATGTSAQEALLSQPRYQNLSIDQAIAKYAPPQENDTGRYQSAIQQALGVPGSTPMNSLSPDQLDRMVAAMQQHEGYTDANMRNIMNIGDPFKNFKSDFDPNDIAPQDNQDNGVGTGQRGETVSPIPASFTSLDSGNNFKVNDNGIELDGKNFNISTNGEIIDLTNNSKANILGSNNTVEFTGSNGFVGVQGTAETINNNDASNLVNINGDGSSANVYGDVSIGLYGSGQHVSLNSSGDHLTIYGGFTNEGINATGDIITLGGNASANVYGSSDAIQLQANNGAYVGVFGQNQTVTGDNGSSSVNLGGDGTSATVYGGGYVGLCGSNETLTVGDWGSTVATINNAANETITAAHTNINLGANSSANVFGVNDGIHLADNSGDHIAVFGQSQTVTGDDGSNGVNLGGNGTSATVYGGGYVGVCDSNQTLTLGDWGSTVNTVPNITGDTVIGNHSTVNFDHDVTAAVDGSNDAVTGVFGHDRVEVSGNQDSFRFNSSDVDFQGQTYGDSFTGGGDSYFENGSYLGGDDPNGGYEGGGWDTSWDDGWYDDPVVLNLKGQAVQTVSADQSNAHFNARNDGNLVGVGWGTPGEGYLVDLPDGKTTVTRDADLVQSFAALRGLDTNHDGRLDASDAAWSNLKVWVDPVGHADPTQGALVSLGDLGIVSIDVNATPDRHGDNGNKILDEGTFTRNDGTKGDIAGVAFRIAGDSAQPAASAPTSAASNLASASATQASQLVAAMATFGVSSAADTTLSTSAQTSPAVLSVDPSVHQSTRIAA